MKELDIKGRNYLKFQSEQPWRYSFSVIKNQPAECFFIMEDVFSDQEFLLYSPGVKKTLEDQLVHAMAEYDLDTINTKNLTKSFKTEYNNGVYRLSLKN